MQCWGSWNMGSCNQGLYRRSSGLWTRRIAIRWCISVLTLREVDIYLGRDWAVVCFQFPSHAQWFCHSLMKKPHLSLKVNTSPVASQNLCSCSWSCTLSIAGSLPSACHTHSHHPIITFIPLSSPWAAAVPPSRTFCPVLRVQRHFGHGCASGPKMCFVASFPLFVPFGQLCLSPITTISRGRVVPR
jgi:hypothetical protein